MKLNYTPGFLAIVLPGIVALGMAGAPAQAQRPGPPPEAVEIAHRAMRDKIIHEAHDRFDVRFDRTEIAALGPEGREVTGHGFFRRRGKSDQTFTYHITVKPREGIAFHAGYEIR